MHRQTERQTDSAKLQDDRKTNKQMYRYTNVPTYIPSVLKTDIQTDRQDRQIRKENRPTDRRTASI
jgi:hypothetical protein